MGTRAAEYFAVVIRAALVDGLPATFLGRPVAIHNPFGRWRSATL
jgi:hypothetical protein